MKILVIVGPTASGKTSLGVDVAKQFEGELVSADSRQVYKKLDIGTGKDIPKNAKFNFVSQDIGGYYLVDGVKIWGYDLVDPDEKYSVSQYINDARNIIKDINSRNKLPILVGGTGFYIKGVVDGIDTAHIPRNQKLRKNLKKFSVNELFEKLANMDPGKAASMNMSDKKNPRRLMRAIEVALWRMENDSGSRIKQLDADTLFIGIKVKLEKLRSRIKNRIKKRLEQGFEDEVEELSMSGVGWGNQSMQALGYKQWQVYLKGNIPLEEAVEEWFKAEVKYAKKQMTWFSKDQRINWFEQDNEEWQKEVLQLVDEWIKQNESTKDRDIT